jgi:ferredoxin
MRIMVDRELCEVNAACVRRAPEVFTIDDENQLRVLVERPGPELVSKARTAVDRCPRGALSLAEDE